MRLVIQYSLNSRPGKLLPLTANWRGLFSLRSRIQVANGSFVYSQNKQHVASIWNSTFPPIFNLGTSLFLWSWFLIWGIIANTIVRFPFYIPIGAGDFECQQDAACYPGIGIFFFGCFNLKIVAVRKFRVHIFDTT
jgi:hypothetical protein